jgi:hypothetical protein
MGFVTPGTNSVTMDGEMPILNPTDLPPEPSPEPKWLVYQKAVAQLKAAFGDCDVIHDHKIVGRRSGVERQVDIWLSITVGGKHGITVAVECKCHETIPVAIKDVDAFYGFLDDVGANKGVLISNTGFTDGAKRRSDGSIVELETLTLEEAEEFDWADFIEHRCQGLGNCWGRISWDLHDDVGSHAGHCDYCSTFHIDCGECGHLDSYREDEIIQCNGCEARWRLEDEKGMTIGIERVGPDSAEAN